MRIKLTFALLTIAACAKQEAPPPIVYQAVPVERRDIIVSARASGTIQPDTTVEVKSKASGEILDIMVETGSLVKRGSLMISVDPRTARNTMAQAEAQLEVAKARLANAASQKKRADELFASKALTETEFEQSQLDYANARAAVVSAQVDVENARIQLEDTDVRSPISGTVIEKSVERGQVISSPTRDVGGGTVLLKMADLNLVQVRTLVDETDIGKIQQGLRSTVTVDAYPNRPFQGSVLKVEPMAVTQQNVTMFPVLVRIENREGLLKPGMNAEVEIHVGRRDSVLAVPNSALRTQRDVESAAGVLGLSPEEVKAQLAVATASPKADSAKEKGDAKPAEEKPAANTMTGPNGQTIVLPAGVTETQVRAIFSKRMSGGEITAEERALLRKVFQGMGGGPGGGGRPAMSDNRFGGRYIVFVQRGGRPVATNITTGLTDLDYAEVASGLQVGDSVLILPSASLIQSQKEFTERMNRMTGGGGLPGMRSNQQQPSSSPAQGGGRP
ncbi:MAG: efflux RND transporter periplasmic adaptor subunit [Gemmatimonadota bacterium]|nr:efflux RND transporter periplasmic adaptor subunit [Gemmatimonadota bacterium]